MALIVASLSYEVIEALRPLVPRIKRHDRSLADQLVRAASSVALNIGEAELSDPGNRKARFFTAAGSANETRGTEGRCGVGLLREAGGGSGRGTAAAGDRHALEADARVDSTLAASVPA